MSTLSMVRKFAAPALAAAVAGLLTVSANATPMLRLTQGTNQVTVTDNGTGDWDARDGALIFFGSLGVFDTNVTTGITKPILGSVGQPEMDLNSIQVSSSSAGTIVIEFSETDFSTAGPILALASIVGGTGDGTVQYETFASLTNTNFATDIPISDTLPQSGLVAFEDLSNVALNGLYSLTMVVTITHTSPGQNSSFNALLQIPEPGLSPALLIGALVVTARIATRRRRSRA